MTTTTDRFELLAELRETADLLHESVHAFVRRHQETRLPEAAAVAAVEAVDTNGRLILGDLLAARGQVLAAIAHLTPQE
jgi:hypothetical protein